jgi:dipeptidyl aminopeptidase/acylaminoacyl peptidase
MRLALTFILSVALTGCVTASSQPPPTSTLPSTATPAPQPSPFPRHANQFAYTKPDTSIWIVNADTLEQRELVPALGTSVWGSANNAEWSPDGRYLAYRRPPGILELLELDNGQTTVLDDGMEALVSQVPPLEWLSATTIEYYRGDSLVPSGRSAWLATIDGGRSAIPDTDPKCVPSSPSCDFVIRFEPVAGHGALYLVRVSTGEEKPLSETAEVLGWTWSPDGRWLAHYVNAGGGSAVTDEIHILSLDTGRDINLGTFNTDEHARWAPTRERLIFYNLEIDPETGAVTVLFPRPSASISWSPDLSKVAFVEGDIWGKGTLVTLDLASGKRTELVSIDTMLSHPLVPGLGGTWSPDGRYLSFFAWTDGMGNKQDYYLFDSHTGLVSRVLTFDQGADNGVSHSPDWSRLLVSQDVEGGKTRTLSVANPDGSSPTVIGEGMPLRRPWRPTEGENGEGAYSGSPE